MSLNRILSRLSLPTSICWNLTSRLFPYEETLFQYASHPQGRARDVFGHQRVSGARAFQDRARGAGA
jgi:hypothetical protein